MEKIRVAHVITNIDGSGGVKNTLLTCAGLDHTRYDIDLIVGSQCDRSRIEDLDVTLIQIPTMHSPFRPLSDALAARELLKLFRQRRHHIVHTHFGKAGILGRWAAHKAQIPILIHGLHGATFNPSQNPLVNAVDKLAERAATRWTDVVISVGEDLMQRYLDAGVGHPEQYVIIHSGMDLSAYRKAAALNEHVRRAKRRSLGLQEDAFVAGCIANLEHRKGHRHLVRLIAQLAPRYPNLHLILAGEGPEKPRLQALVRRAGLTDRIHFLGYREDVPEIMAVMNVKLFASEREGLAQVLVQADAVGIPILAFEVEGARETIKEGVNGYIFPQGDITGMAQALATFIENPHLAKKMGQAGRKLVDQRWEIITMQQKTQALYESLLTKKGIDAFFTAHPQASP